MKKIIYNKNKINYIKHITNSKYIDKIFNKDQNDQKRYVLMTGDFETIIHKSKHIVISAGYKIKDNNESFFICNYHEDIKKNSDDLLDNYMTNLIELYAVKKYLIHVLYFHNLSGFDGLFIMQWLNKEINKVTSKKLKIDIAIRNNVIYYIKIGNLHILDSLKILPQKLNSLSKTFLNKEKISFDTTKVNSENVYELKEEILIYMKEDILLLYDILKCFHKRIKEEYNISIYKCVSITSLSFKIYRSIFFKKKKYNIIKSTVALDIQSYMEKSYLGGVCDVYIPYGENLYYYDINSSYPYSMKEYPMPVGEPIKRDGKININNFFGFIRVKIYVPEDIFLPPLAINYNYKTVNPVGYFDGIFFSEELKASLKWGVKIIHIYDGYEFNKGNLFKDFVEHFYEKRIKCKENKDDVGNLLYKMILNSLYGRFGMKPDIEFTLPVTEKNIKIYEELFQVTNYHNINKERAFVTFKTEYKDLIKEYEKIKEYDGNNEYHKLILNKTYFINNLNIATHISSAITGYSRINIMEIKKYCNDNNIKVYYTDTDSIIIDKKLPEKYVGNEIGKYKLEHEIKRGYFIAPKVYYMVLEKENKCVFKGLEKKKSTELNEEFFKDQLELNKNMKAFNVKKSFMKSYKDFSIREIDTSIRFELSLTKREPIYKNNKLVSTRPLKINNKEIIDIIETEEIEENNKEIDNIENIEIEDIEIED